MSKKSRKIKRQKKNAKKRASKVKAIRGETSAGSASSLAPGFERRLHEIGMARVQAAISGRELESIEEIEAYVVSEEGQRIYGEPPEPSADDAPEQRIQYLLEQAYSAKGNRRKKLARDVLEIDPGCTEAYNILGEFIQFAEDAYPHFQRAVHYAEQALGEQFFNENAGHFWGLLETRPYMRALASLSSCAWVLEKRAEAIELLQRMIELNPNDNQGVRDQLVSYLLHQGRYQEAETMLTRYDDQRAFHMFNFALLQFAQHGITPDTTLALGEAILENKYVPKYLLGMTTLPRAVPASFQFGSREEARIYVDFAGDSWRQIEGAIDWLRHKYSVGKEKQRQGDSVKDTASAAAKRAVSGLKKDSFDRPDLSPVITSAQRYQLWRDLYACAEQFFTLAPWETWPPDTMYKVHNPFTKRDAVCVLLGQNGESFGLLCLPDQKSFDRYLSIAEGRHADFDMSEIPEHFSFEFVLPAEADSLDRALAKEFEWPENAELVPAFRSYIPGYPPAYLDFDEACFALTVFDMGIHFVTDHVPSVLSKGDEVAVFRLKEPAKIFPGIMKRRAQWKAKREKQFTSGPFDPASVAGFDAVTQGSSVRGTSWEVGLRSLPSVVLEDDQPFVPRGWIFIDRQTEFLLDIVVLSPQDLPLQKFTESLIKSIEQFGAKPECIRIKKREALAAEIMQICQLAGIRVEKVSSLKALTQAFRALSASLRSDEPESEYH